MIRLEGMACQSEKLEHASDSFRLQSMNNSRTRLLPCTEFNIGGFLTEFKSHSLESLEQSKSAALIKSLFGLIPTQSLDSADHSLNNLPDSLNSSTLKPKVARVQCGSSQQEGQASMYVAYPETKRCFVCKQMFQNYFKHISTTKHKKNQKRLMNENRKFNVDQKITQLINSVNKTNGGSKETSHRISARFQQNQGHDIDPFFQGSFPSKRRVLSNGISIQLKSADSTSLVNLSRSRKRSCFEQ